MAWTRKSSPPHSFFTVSNVASTEAMFSTSHGITSLAPIEDASGLTRLPSASPWYVKASSAPCAASVLAIPHAIEWSLATPMISPRFPCISDCISPPLRSTPAPAVRSRFQPLEHDRRICAAEAERVRQHAAERDVVAPLAHDRHVGEGGIERLDVRALADEAVVHHQERIDRLLRAGRTERMAGQRLGRRDRRHLGAKDLADRLDLLEVADRRRGGVRVDVVDRRLDALERHAHAAHRALARRRHHVLAVRGRAVAGDLAVDLRTPGTGMLELL